ncbi:MAG: molybdopterin-synthase adenylyltransferase MoeB [Pseudomonadota bacterium]
MNDEDLLRFSRQIMLPDFDIEGQEQLANSCMLILGLGGLGSPVALYLAAAGVGHLKLVDDDQVDLSNLQRQIAHTNENIGIPKVASAAARIQEINPRTKLSTHPVRFDTNNLDDLLSDVTVALDCTDNYRTRYLLNDACWRRGIPVVSGAAIRWEGQVTVFDPTADDSPCYRCLYPNAGAENLNCSENGVIAPLVGMIGTTQAMEAIKLATGTGENLVGRLLHLDAKYLEFRELKLKRREDCPTCAQAGTD